MLFYIFDISTYFRCKQNTYIMKTLFLSQRQSLKSFGFIAILLVTMFAFNTSYAQSESASTERTVKGVVNDINGPLKDVNIIEKGTRNGTVTNTKGEFTFPVKLKTGAILVFSYLGYEAQEITIETDTKFIELELNEDLVEIIGALDSGKPYKSKRKKKN